MWGERLSGIVLIVNLRGGLLSLGHKPYQSHYQDSSVIETHFQVTMNLWMMFLISVPVSFCLSSLFPPGVGREWGSS